MKTSPWGYSSSSPPSQYEIWGPPRTMRPWNPRPRSRPSSSCTARSAQTYTPTQRSTSSPPPGPVAASTASTTLLTEKPAALTVNCSGSTRTRPAVCSAANRQACPSGTRGSLSRIQSNDSTTTRRAVDVIPPIIVPTSPAAAGGRPTCV